MSTRFGAGLRVRIRESDGSTWEGIVGKAIELPDGTHEYEVHIRPSTSPATPPRWYFEASLELVAKALGAFA